MSGTLKTFLSTGYTSILFTFSKDFILKMQKPCKFIIRRHSHSRVVESSFILKFFFLEKGSKTFFGTVNLIKSCWIIDFFHAQLSDFFWLIITEKNSIESFHYFLGMGHFILDMVLNIIYWVFLDLDKIILFEEIRFFFFWQNFMDFLNYFLK